MHFKFVKASLGQGLSSEINGVVVRYLLRFLRAETYAESDFWGGVKLILGANSVKTRPFENHSKGFKELQKIF